MLSPQFGTFIMWFRNNVWAYCHVTRTTRLPIGCLLLLGSLVMRLSRSVGFRCSRWGNSKGWSSGKVKFVGIVKMWLILLVRTILTMKNQWQQKWHPFYHLLMSSWKFLCNDVLHPNSDISADLASVLKYGQAWVLQAIQTQRVQEQASGDTQAELCAYLDSKLESTDDVVHWWGVSMQFWLVWFLILTWFHWQEHSLTYLTLSHIAHDYLAIQGSSVPSEWAFSSGALATTTHWNCLAGRLLEAIQILKSGYQTGLVSARHQAESHHMAYLEDLA